MSVSQGPKNGTFIIRLTHDSGKKKPRCFSFFPILVKLRPEIVFNDMLKIKETFLENTDIFKGVNR